MILKRLIMLSTVAITLVLVFALTSCDFIISVDDISSTEIEAMMDDAMTGDNYTMVYEIKDVSTVTLKVGGGEMHISIRANETYDEYYLHCDDQLNKYVFAHDWKFSEENKGFEKATLTKEQYVVKYMEMFSQYAHTEKLFNYRHILDMAEQVTDDETHFKYYNEIYEVGEFLRKEYEIKYANESLEITEKRTETVLNEEFTNETDMYKLVVTNMKTTYSKVGNTDVSFPAKVTN